MSAPELGVRGVRPCRRTRRGALDCAATPGAAVIGTLGPAMPVDRSAGREASTAGASPAGSPATAEVVGLASAAAMEGCVAPAEHQAPTRCELQATGAGVGGAEESAGLRTRGRLGGEPTLDTLLSGVWEGLVAHMPVACPLCGGEMRPSYSSHALPVGGACASCGTRIS